MPCVRAPTVQGTFHESKGATTRRPEVCTLTGWLSSATLRAQQTIFFFGGPTLHNFSLALTIGIWFGIYSSVFVAAAISMWLGVKREDLVKPIKKDEGGEVVEG